MDHEMMVLFAGNENVHGTYRIDKKTQSGKQVGKAETKREPLTIENWQSHLKGEVSLGVVPITNKGVCAWGCIDIDEYDLDHTKLANQIQSHQLPMFVCTTKSGGAHVFAFFKTPISAINLQGWLKGIAAGLGYGGSEIFPKQTEILEERGDVGNWLNMPYFGGDETNRYCVAPNGKKLSLKEFLEITMVTRIDPNAIDQHTIKVDKGILDEGPPCLQVLCKNGFPKGTGNNGLFNLAVFAKKKFPEQWKEKVEELNQTFFDPHRPSDEVQQLIRQHGKKDYAYKCNDTPICNFCNSSVCRTRKFGVGTGGAMPSMSGLTKLDSDPPLWFLTVESSRMELTTKALQVQEEFHKQAIEQLNIFPPKLQQSTWQTMVQDLLNDVIVIEQPEDVKSQGIFSEHMEGFTTARNHKEKKADLLRGLSWTDTRKEISYFRLSDFIKYCKNHGYVLERNQASARIRDIGGIAEQLWVAEAKKNVAVWAVPAYTLATYDAKPPEEPKI